VTASIGVASCPAHGTDGATLIASADAALYRSKRNGRNQTTLAGLETDADIGAELTSSRAEVMR
jgi:predicted signal transduction protein with EAL and GGDEF domain